MAASSTDTAWALRFISGKYQGGEFPLKMNRQVTIGRSSELDMVLVEDMVSRKHAKITVGPGKVLIEDLGSTNGTFVNGEKIRQARLKEGTGSSSAPRSSSWSSARRAPRPSCPTPRCASGWRRRAGPGVEDQQDLVDDREDRGHPAPGPAAAVPHLEEERGAGGHRRPRGPHLPAPGRVYYAVVDGDHALGPQKSFNRIITWEEGDFELQPPDGQEFMVELDRSTEALLMDALRLLDEYKRIEGQLPAAESPLSVRRRSSRGSGPHPRAAGSASARAQPRHARGR
jgi:hypothetical protein